MAFITVYHAAWTFHRVYETIGAGNQTMGWELTAQITIIGCAVLSLALQSLRMWMLTILAVVVADFQMAPFIWDSEYWCILTDLALLASALRVCGKQLFTDFRPIPSEKKAAVMELTRESIMAQMTIFYSAAAFWKCNVDFLHPHSSCAPIFFMQLLDWYLPPHVELAESALQLLTSLSPYLVLILEGFIAYTLWIPSLRRTGVLAAIVLHLSIAACPPPENVATFSLMCASRLVCFVPLGSSLASTAKTWTPLQVAAIGVATAVGANLAKHEGFYDLALPLFVLATPFLLKSALLDETYHSRGNKSVPRAEGQEVFVFAVAIAFFYAYLMIPLGLMDQGQPHMYANLRLHGGTNHILGIPTSLLQQWFETTPTSPFYGGIVRIESSTSRLLNEIYPSDYTNQMTDRARRMMLQGGHTSRNFNPMLTVCTASEAPWDPSTSTFVRYTIPAHEFRRVLTWVRENEVGKYEIEYTQLEGHGDETWRALATGRCVRLQERTDGTKAVSKCSVKSGGLCTELDLPNLPPLPFWSRKLMLFEPYPIIPNDYMLHCFGP